MEIHISPRSLSGEIAAIASKSYAIRLLIAAALADQPTVIRLNSRSRDIDAAGDALTALGAEITRGDQSVTVRPRAQAGAREIPCGESGTVARLLLPVAAALRDAGTITGEGSLLSRPFATLCDAMEKNGCRFESKSLPVRFTSRLRSGRYEISGNESSQYISGLIFALPLLDGDSEICLTSPLESAGYIDMTRSVLRLFGVEDVENTENGYRIGGWQRYCSPGMAAVEGDWSNAAFWLAAGVTVTGLDPASLQKDRLFLELKDAPAVDAAQVPDLVPILAVNAAARHGVTRIYNAGRLRIKESDRLETVWRMLTALGGDVDRQGDGLVIRGRGSLTGGTVDSFGDHRIVMAAAIAACICENDVILTNAQAVEKSYPGFFEDYNALGGEAHVLRLRQ